MTTWILVLVIFSGGKPVDAQDIATMAERGNKGADQCVAIAEALQKTWRAPGTFLCYPEFAK
jgi:hypothetical protein